MLACEGTAGVFGIWFGDKQGEGGLGCVLGEDRVFGVIDRIGGLSGSSGLVGRSA